MVLSLAFFQGLDAAVFWIFCMIFILDDCSPVIIEFA